MTKRWSPKHSFLFGVVRYRDLAYLALATDELARDRVPHAHVLEWDQGEWCTASDGEPFAWSAVAATVVAKPKEQALFVGEQGQVFCMGSGDVHEEQIATPEAIAARGKLRDVATVAGVAYACGMDRQVYRRGGKNKWAAFDEGARPPARSRKVVGFEAIGGFGAKELYAVGWDGAIWQCEDGQWQPRKSPTGAILSALCCGEDGVAYACGQSGTLVRGREDCWEAMASGVDEDLWSLAWFDGRLYAASASTVYALGDQGLAPVKFGRAKPSSCGRLSAGDGVLWSIGEKDVFAFDGGRWSRID